MSSRAAANSLPSSSAASLAAASLSALVLPCCSSAMPSRWLPADCFSLCIDELMYAATPGQPWLQGILRNDLPIGAVATPAAGCSSFLHSQIENLQLPCHACPFSPLKYLPPGAAPRDTACAPPLPSQCPPHLLATVPAWLVQQRSINAYVVQKAMQDPTRYHHISPHGIQKVIHSAESAQSICRQAYWALA